jgi:O-antigen/teichoic acid export membrane protein
MKQVFKKINLKIDNILLAYKNKIGLDLPYFFNSALWMTLRQGVEVIAGFFLLSVFARFTSKEVFGQYQLIISIFSMVSILSLPGINTAVMRSVARGCHGDYKLGVKTSFVWSLLGIPSLLVVGAYYYLMVNQLTGVALMISSIFFPFFYAPNTWSFFLQGKKLYKTLFKFSSIRALLNALVTALVIFLSKDNLLPIILTYFFVYSLFSVFYYLKSKKYIENNKKDPEMIGYGKLITKVGAFNIFAENIDKIIIGFMLSVSEVAIFSIISMVAIKFRGSMSPIISIVFPKMTSDGFNFKDIWLKRKKLFLIPLFVTIIPSIFYFLFIEKASLVFFGNEYTDYYQYSKIFTIFLIVSLPIALANIYVIAKKMIRTIAYVRPIYFFIKVVISVISIYFWGLPGMIWAYNISAIVLFFLYLILINREPLRSKHSKPNKV